MIKNNLFRLLVVLFLIFQQQIAFPQKLMKLIPGQPLAESAVQEALEVPYSGKLRLENLRINDAEPSVVNLELQRFAVTDQLTEVVVHTGTQRRVEKTSPRAYFSGKLEGENASFVFLSVDGDGAMRSIIHRGDQVIVNELSATETGARRSSAPSSRKVNRALDFAGREFNCQVDPQFIEKTRSSASETLRRIVNRASANVEAFQTSELVSQRRADIIVETDYEYFVKLGGNSTAAANYAVDLFAYISARYQSEIGARLLIKQLNIYTTPSDPWLQTTSSDLLDELQSFWNNPTLASVPRHHVHMLSSKSGGGGVAYLNTLGMPTYAYGVSTSINGGFSPSNPQIVWDSVVVAHELGHAFSSTHTQNYDNPYAGSNVGGAIDCCYSDNSTGQCGVQLGGAGKRGFLPGPGSIFGGGQGQENGTIMSYCHTLVGGISNINFTFGTNYPYGVNPDRVATVMKAAAQQYLPLDGASTYSLTVSTSGTGSGTVASNPAGISCGTDCSESYASGTSVVLTATAASGSAFAGWGDACSGLASSCTVNMSAAKTVTASFTTVSANRLITVTKTGSGTGTVTSSPSGISCSTSCGVASSSFSSTSSVTLIATPTTGSTFVGWSGACSGTGSCTVAAGTTSASVGAAFNTTTGAVVILKNGVAVTGLSGSIASSALFSVVVPSGATNLVIQTTGGSGDADLYTRFGQVPTRTVYDCISDASSGSAESCSNGVPAAGTHYVLLYGYSAFSGVTLSASYSTGGATSYTLSVSRTGTGSGLIQSTNVSALVWRNASSGRSSKQIVPTSEIVGGTAAALGAWPWQVKLSIVEGGSSYLCGGSLLSDQWVVTAAHCIDNAGTTVSPSAVTVRAGSLSLDSGGQLVGVSRIIKHSSYVSSTKDNDIALLQLSSPVTLSSTVNVVQPLLSVQEATLAATNDLGTVTGWGNTSSGGSTSSTLMQVQVPMLTSSDCARLSAYGSYISNNMICAGYPAGGKDSCQGDSGGPLVVPNDQGAYVLAGIVSWGNGCALPNYPGVYTRVANYMAWLQSSTGLVLDGSVANAINCGTTCIANFKANSTVTLQATALTGSTFTGWGGACTGTGNCIVSMTAAKTVTAAFTLVGAGSTITGTPGDDILTNGTGNNMVDGLAGLDTYISAGQASGYRLSRGTSNWTLTDSARTYGSDTLSNIERLRFSTGLHLLDIDKGQIGGMAYRIYKAAFNRQPDIGGLKYWVSRMDAGSSVMDVAAGFIASAEFVALYGSNPSDGDFITQIYSNVLGRAPDAGGYAYWIGVLSSGSSRQQVLASFSESDENVNNVAATISNGIWLSD